MYAIFNCARTYELYRVFRDVYHVRIPIERGQVVRKGQVVDLPERPAMLGICFVPVSEAEAFKVGVPEWFHVRQLRTPRGRAHTVAPAELAKMQALLNEQGKLVTDKEVWFEVGSRAKIALHPHFTGLTGTVQRVKSCGTVRLKMDNGLQFVEINKKFLKVLLDVG